MHVKEPIVNAKARWIMETHKITQHTVKVSVFKLVKVHSIRKKMQKKSNKNGDYYFPFLLQTFKFISSTADCFPLNTGP